MTSLDTLEEHIKSNNLSKITLSSDGKTISFETDDQIDATTKHTILEDKSYSLASLFLLCKNPESLVSYRKACKEFNIDDIVKASDRNDILSYFNLNQQQAQQDDDIDIDQEKHRHDKKDKQHRIKHDKKVKEEHGKKEKAPMTNEQVMQNLAIVAGKRGENRKVKADDVTMMEEMAHVTADKDENVEEETEQIMPLSPNKSELVNNEEDAERQRILNALNAKGYEVNEELVNNDRINTTNDILSKEQPVGDSASILCFPSRDFTRVLELYLAVKKQEEGLSNRPTSKTLKKSKQPIPQQQPNKKPKPTGLPIIIIPNAMTSPITMINASEFFHSAKFTPRDVVIKKLGGLRNIKKSSGGVLNITRNISSRFGGGSITFEVIDNPIMKLKHSSDWDRIVAVIAQGAEWQFKGWKYAQPVDIFSKTFGFYVGYEGAPVPKEILQWNVKLGYVHRDKRGLDTVTYSSFWNSLDEWIAVHKPEYLPKDPTIL